MTPPANHPSSRGAQRRGDPEQQERPSPEAPSPITTIADLEAIDGDLDAVGEASTAKVADHVTPAYRRYLEAASFAALATIGPEGLDCSPRGDKPGFIRIHDDRTRMLPDRRGNNRIDSLRNVVRDPRVNQLSEDRRDAHSDQRSGHKTPDYIRLTRLGTSW